MVRLRDLSIRTKLSTLLTIVVAVVLLLGTAAGVLVHYQTARSDMQRQVGALAEILADQSRAGLQFGDQQAAGEVLAPLGHDAAIVRAVVRDAQGGVFAEYVRTGDVPVAPPSGHDANDESFAQGSFHVFHEIRDADRTLGSLYLQASLKHLHESLRRAIGVNALVFFVCLSIALGLGHGLQRVIAEPIRRLAAASERVSVQRDYSVRVEKHGRDEIGVLCDAFNSMLAEIQKRESEVRRANTVLEERVHERTRDLEAQAVALAAANAALKRSNEELEDFAYISSHDLQEPLRKVRAFGDMLATKFGDTLGEEGQDFIRRMQNASNRMQTLINDLLHLSRVTRKGNPFGPVKLDNVVRTVLEDLETSITEAGGTARVSPLPALEADATQMRQLFQNLIGNAFKYRRDHVAPVVEVTASPRTLNGSGEYWEFAVRDNGIGFKPQYAEQIFQPFKRLVARSKYNGTGIGLAICRKIVERHRGTIRAEGRPGEGASFFVTLPASQQQGAIDE